MSFKRKLKEEYKKMLIKSVKSKVGRKIYSFIAGTASILDEEFGKPTYFNISERLMVSKLIENDGKEITYTNRKDSANFYFLEGELKKIKVRAVLCNPGTFSAIETVCEAFEKDDKYDLGIVIMHDSGYSFSLISKMQANSFKYIFSDEYDVKEDCPDIIIFYHLEYRYNENLIEAGRFSRMVVLIPLTLTTIWYGERSISRMHLDVYQPGVVFATNLVMDRLEKFLPNYKLLEMIPPQVDIFFRRTQEERRNQKGWEKLDGKKIILYMTDHGLNHYNVSDELGVDLYLPILLEYMKRPENKEMGLIIRPHFSLIRELLANYWSVDDYKKFIEFCDKSENIVWDETDDYLNGLTICDSIISDINTSVAYFSLASMKPIAISLRYDVYVPLENKDFTDALYLLHSNNDCIKYLDMIKSGKDPKLPERKVLFDRLMSPFDGNNGLRIKNAIEREYESKYGI